MRKFVAASTLFVAAAATLAGASVALADDKHPTPLPTAGVQSEPINPHSGADDDNYEGVIVSDGDSAKERRAHHELELKYGKDGAFQIPPLVIKPGQPIEDATTGTSFGSAVVGPAATKGQTAVIAGPGTTGSAAVHPTNGGSVPMQGQNPTQGGQNPIAPDPIDFSKIVLHQQSPAETFMQVSSTALIVMALGAVGFGGYLLVNRSSRDRIHPVDEEYSA
ncbi:MAG: hypothetical protein KGL77_05685 [Actinomycetales bacterium]|nr:hypothetical protein [Actinomycetales bacterium]